MYVNFSAEIQFGVICYTPDFFRHDNVGPENSHGLAVGYFIFCTLRNFFINIILFPTFFLLLHPPLLEVEPQCQKQQFSPPFFFLVVRNLRKPNSFFIQLISNAKRHIGQLLSELADVFFLSAFCNAPVLNYLQHVLIIFPTLPPYNAAYETVPE